MLTRFKMSKRAPSQTLPLSSSVRAYQSIQNPNEKLLVLLYRSPCARTHCAGVHLPSLAPPSRPQAAAAPPHTHGLVLVKHSMFQT